MLGPGIEPGSLQMDPTVVPAAPKELPGEAAVVRRESFGVLAFVSPFRMNLCHFWVRFCVTFLDEFVTLLGAILCHFFGRICVTFGSDFVSLFWTNLCHFWERFCVAVLDEISATFGRKKSIQNRRNFVGKWREKVLQNRDTHSR